MKERLVIYVCSLCSVFLIYINVKDIIENKEYPQVYFKDIYFSPAPGYKIVKNQKGQYAFVFPGGFVSTIDTYKTKEEAFTRSWMQYKYDKKVNELKSCKWDEIRSQVFDPKDF